MSQELYAKREKLVSQIPNFWPLVFEQSPPDIDEYLQPSDSAVLFDSLIGLTVERFELPGGDPRSISVKFQFKENDDFEDKVLEKKFWWRVAKDDWEGLVSEPVQIKWKKGKDLTSGMLDLVHKVWKEEEAGQDEDTEAKKALKAQIESTGLGGLSFFAWFGFRGRKVTAAESQEAAALLKEKRRARKEGKEVDAMEEDEEDEEEDNDEYEMEIFPTGDDLAVCIAEDLWPAAIKYFSESTVLCPAPGPRPLLVSSAPLTHLSPSQRAGGRRYERCRLRVGSGHGGGRRRRRRGLAQGQEEESVDGDVYMGRETGGLGFNIY